MVNQECGVHFTEASDELLAKIFLQVMYEIPLPEESDGVRRMRSHLQLLQVLLCEYGDRDEEELRQMVDVNIDRYVTWAVTLAPTKGCLMSYQWCREFHGSEPGEWYGSN